MKKNNNTNDNRKAKAIVIISIIVFLLVLLDIFLSDITSYDNWAYSVFVENFRSDTMTKIMQFITSFGSFIMIGIIIVLLSIFVKNKKVVFLLAFNTLIIVLINDFLKFVVHRPRPSGYNLINESNYSFPSGHSMVSTFFYGFIIYMVYKYIKNKKLKIALISLLSILIVLICISRIYLGVHYLSDTIAGFTLSLIYIQIFLMYNHEIERKC